MVLVKAILTNRELKNKVTGIDLYVSDYQEVPHKIRNTFLYHVIVVTNLFYYKAKEHKQSDVVQFMVSKTFEEFEELYQKLYKRFPSVNFPPLPSKLSIAGNKTDQRLQCMDKVMKLVASTQKLASSTMVISFLKGDVENFQSLVQQRAPADESTMKNTEKESITEQLIDKQSEVPDEKPTAAKTTTTVDDDNLFEVDLSDNVREGDSEIEGLEVGMSSVNIESGAATGGARRGKVSLFDDDDTATGSHVEDDLFTTPGGRKSAFEKNYELDGDDDVDEDLLDVKDDLDDLLSLSRSSEKQSAIKVQKPSLPPRQKSGSLNISELAGDESEEKNGIFQRQKSQSLIRKEDPLKESNSSTLDDIFSKSSKKGLFDDDDDDDLFSSSSSSKPTNSADIDSMGQEDILNYIQSNN